MNLGWSGIHLAIPLTGRLAPNSPTWLALVHEFIEKIIIYQSEKLSDKKRTQQIDIYYNGVGIIEDNPDTSKLKSKEKCGIVCCYVAFLQPFSRLWCYMLYMRYTNA